MAAAEQAITVQDIMTRDVISVRPETSLFDAAKLIAEHNFDGVPTATGNFKISVN